MARLLLMTLLQESVTSGFEDLGILLLGGVAAAIVCAVAFTVVRLKLREKRPQTSSFISISAPDTPKEPT
jgi:hypothetical protein